MQQILAAEDRLVAIATGHGTDAGSKNHGDGPLHIALSSICDRAASILGASAAWLERLGAHLEEYIQGCRWERELRKQGKVPSLSTYSKLRLIISAVYPCFDFAGMCIDPSSTDVAEKNSLIHKLEDMANNHICWVNDNYGVDKEIKEETTSNIVIVIAQEHGLSWKDALDEAILMCNKEVDSFVEHEECIYALGSVDDNAKAYIHALKTWMRGHFDWYLDTKRYSAEESSKVSTGTGSRKRPSMKLSWRLLVEQ